MFTLIAVRPQKSTAAIPRVSSIGIRKVAGAQDSLLVAERFVEGLSKHDADILYSVMLVDFKVAQRLELKVETSVMSKAGSSMWSKKWMPVEML